MSLFRTNPQLLKTLLEDVESAKIQLPDFQRGWVWDDDRIRGLLASISRGFPIGAVMMLDAHGELRFKSRVVEGVPDLGRDTEQFLLDGQQRLTSLYQALRHPGPVTTHDNRGQRIRRWYYVDILRALDPSLDREECIVSVPENRRIIRDFGREIVLDLSTPEHEYRQHMMPTERLLDSVDWMIRYLTYWNSNGAVHPRGDTIAFMENVKAEVLDVFSEYSLPVITLEKETPKEAVCTVFEKVNTGGVTLTVFELVTASFAADDFSLRDDWAAYREQLHSNFAVLRGIEGEQFLQAISLLATQARRRRARLDGAPEDQLPPISARKRDILNLTLDEYQFWAPRVSAAFESAAKFLHRQFVFAEPNVPYNTQLVPLAALYAELADELRPGNAQALLERWFWSGVFSESYGGATETQYALDLAEVAEFVRNGQEPRLISEASFIPERLITLRTRNSAAYKGLYALQMKEGAVDWRTGLPLSIATWDNEHIDIHHIFPVAWCKSAVPEVPPRLYNSIINKTPIDAQTNRIIGGASPSHYLKRLERDIDGIDDVVRSHRVNPDMLRDDAFAASFVERGQAMFDLVSGAMGKPSGDARDVFRSALFDAGLSVQGRHSSAVEDSIAAFDDDEDEYDAIGEAAYVA